MAILKTLIVDDEPGIRSGINRILRNHSVTFPFIEEDFTFDLIEADTAEKAMEILNSTAIDIILLDNKLPGMEGIEFLKIISEQKIDVAVMMITSFASLDLAVKATRRGAYNFVPKPFTPIELRSAIENITKYLYLKRMTMLMNEQGKQIRFQFLSVLSHELKSPINAIEGYLRIMQDKQVGENIDSYKTMIERSMERIKGMRTLILDMLDLTKIESGKKTQNLQKIDLIDIAQLTIDSISPLSIQKNVKIYTDFPEQLQYYADPSEIEIIFNNLISNAVKYNKDNGKVDFCIRQKNDNIEIIVEDTGIGICDEDQKMLFQEFVRIKNQKTQQISGSGLGLSILKKIIDMYKGTINLTSKEDVGTKFEISLPSLKNS
jgi:signal transduction histidine kinase